jgi:excinuclease ABC subunit C
VWVLTDDQASLHVFIEQQNVLKLKQSFYFPFAEEQAIVIDDYFIAYYRTYRPASRILINFDLPIQTRTLLQKFLHQWHHLDQSVTIMRPTAGHEAAIIRYAAVAVAQELAKRATVAAALKKLLKLTKEPHTVDCFDISHKQGRFMVGACVRFTEGQPDKKFFRHFYIKTVKGQDDYACLAEIVGRCYREGKNLPDLVLVDGGKGQLAAVRALVPAGVAVASLAKREENVFSDRLPKGRRLDQATYAGQMLIALRDYAHHFAISFHRKIARKSLDKDA